MAFSMDLPDMEEVKEEIKEDVKPAPEVQVKVEKAADSNTQELFDFDLGSLDINGPDQTRDFFFANTGGEPLIIEKVEASCPCLDIVYPKDSIAPGTKSKITPDPFKAYKG